MSISEKRIQRFKTEGFPEKTFESVTDRLAALLVEISCIAGEEALGELGATLKMATLSHSISK